MSRPGDEQWRRPAPDAGEPGAERRAQAYAGPPSAIPPPPGWHPELERRFTPPRPLPVLDHEQIDLAEDRADRFTNVLGIVAGVVLILIACIQWRT
jgi:hypothetical protein